MVSGQIGVVMGMRVPALPHLRFPVWHDSHGMCWCHVHASVIHIQCARCYWGVGKAPATCSCPVEQSSTFDPAPEIGFTLHWAPAPERDLGQVARSPE